MTRKREGESKLCIGCSKSKRLTEFSPDKDRHDGRAGLCRLCNRDRGRIYRKLHGSGAAPTPEALHRLVDFYGYRPKEPDLLHDFTPEETAERKRRKKAA